MKLVDIDIKKSVSGVRIADTISRYTYSNSWSTKDSVLCRIIQNIQ